MALELRTTTAFERDVRRVNRQGKDLNKLETIVNLHGLYCLSVYDAPLRCGDG
jgi:hypothetical protein